MTDILTSPVRVYEKRVAVYFFNGDVQCDIIAPEGPKRDAVLALVAQAQEAFRLLAEMAGDGQCESSVTCAMARSKQFEGMGECPLCRARKVLRDAGVLDV